MTTNNARSTIYRNRALFGLLLGILIVGILVYLLREPLMPFAVGLVVAYLLLPVIDWLEKRLPFYGKKGQYAQRIVIIILLFIVLLAVLVFGAIFLTTSVAGSFSSLFATLPNVITNGVTAIGGWIDSLIAPLSPDIQKQVNDAISTVGRSIGQTLRGAFMTGVSIVSASISFVIGFLILPFFLIFFLSNSHSLGKGFYSLFSRETNRHIHNIAHITNVIVGKYITCQLLLAAVVGVSAYIGFTIIGLDLAVTLAVIAGIFQLIPTLGGAMAAIIGIIVTLAVAPDKLFWVIIIFVIINFVVNTILAPKLQGEAVDLDPAIIIVLIVIGGYLGGIIGMILITPAVALAYDLYQYVRAEIGSPPIETPPL